MMNKFQRLTLRKKLGTDFSGYDDNGRRIMGISTDIVSKVMNYVPSLHFMSYVCVFDRSRKS